MSKDKFTIEIKEYVTPFYESYTFSAIDKGKKIFGAGAEITRHKDIRTDEWRSFKINYGSSGSGTHQEKLPHVTVINKAMEKLKELEGKR